MAKLTMRDPSSADREYTLANPLLKSGGLVGGIPLVWDDANGAWTAGEHGEAQQELQVKPPWFFNPLSMSPEVNRLRVQVLAGHVNPYYQPQDRIKPVTAEGL